MSFQVIMHILIVNPNTSGSLTERMERAARGQVPSHVTLSSRTAPRGFPYISNRAEAQIAGSVTLEMLAHNATGTDAAIIAAFGDPGARAARDLMPFPVIGVAEAAMHSAAMLGERFAILAFARHMQGWYRDCVHQVGLERRFAGFRAPAIAPRSPDTAQEDLHEPLLECLRACELRDGADVVIIAGAPLAGFAARAAVETRLPLVDPVIAALHQAVALSHLAAPGRGRIDPKASTGLDPALAALFAPCEPRANGRARGQR